PPVRLSAASALKISKSQFLKREILSPRAARDRARIAATALPLENDDDSLRIFSGRKVHALILPRSSLRRKRIRLSQRVRIKACGVHDSNERQTSRHQLFSAHQKTQTIARVRFNQHGLRDDGSRW